MLALAGGALAASRLNAAEAQPNENPTIQNQLSPAVQMQFMRPGQLEAEIKENAWLTYPVFEEPIFVFPVAVRWQETLRRIGIDPVMLSDTAGHA